MLFSFSVIINKFCSFNSVKSVAEKNISENICPNLEGKWTAYISKNGKGNMECQDKECGKPMLPMILKCADNKLIGKHMVGYSSEFNKVHWSEFEADINENRIIFEFKNESSAHHQYTVTEIKENRFFGDFTLKWENGNIAIKGDFIAIKQNESD